MRTDVFCWSSKDDATDFSRREMREIFEKADEIPGCDPKQWRSDKYGRRIMFGAYGKIQSPYGWEIDHIKPRALNGKSTYPNLQPLYWRYNREKGDAYPWEGPAGLRVGNGRGASAGSVILKRILIISRKSDKRATDKRRSKRAQ